jgi:hypothetical protein
MSARTPYKCRGPVYDALALLPPRCHWPDRPAPYSNERSEVLAHIAEVAGCDLREAIRIMDGCRRNKIIRYSPQTRSWLGRDYLKGNVPRGTDHVSTIKPDLL